MRLSEAIREGAKLGPQWFGILTMSMPDGRVGCCALGAAGLAVFGKDATINETAIKGAFPLLAKDAYYPGAAAKFRAYRQVGACVTSLNDGERWTREAIADWVETVEAEAGL
jgi:hypothetical protein